MPLSPHSQNPSILKKDAQKPRRLRSALIILGAAWAVSAGSLTLIGRWAHRDCHSGQDWNLENSRDKSDAKQEDCASTTTSGSHAGGGAYSGRSGNAILPSRGVVYGGFGGRGAALQSGG